VHASGADVVGPVSDHDGVACVRSSHRQRCPNEVRFIADTLASMGPVNSIEVVVETEVTHNQPGGFYRADRDDLKGVTSAAERRQGFRDSPEYATLEYADFIEQRPIDFDGAIDEPLILGAQQCGEDHGQTSADKGAQLFIRNRLVSKRRQRLVD